MKIILKILMNGLIIFLLICCCSEIKSETGTKKLSKALPLYLKTFEDTLLHKLQEEQIPGAAVAIVRDSSLTYLKTFGYAENGSDKQIDSSTVFRLASLSKGFAAVLTGILVEEGLLHWDDKVVKHYPEFALKDSAQTQRVEIRHLLTHTSGLPYHAYTNLIEDGMDLDKIIPRLAHLDLIAKEGEVYAYQNAAFAVIEKIIETAADTTFSAVLENKIFKPAHMNYASCTYQDLIYSANYAKPHIYSALQQDYIITKNSEKYYNVVSAGGINASLSDMIQWMRILIGQRQDIISDSTLDYIFSPLVKVNTRRYSRRWESRRSDYALGWRVVNFQGRDIVFHGGYVNSYRSEIAIDLENKLGICVLLNAPHWYSSRIIPEFFKSYFIEGTASAPVQDRPDTKNISRQNVP